MGATVSQLQEFYAGQELLLTFTFTSVSDGGQVDPDVISVSYRDAGLKTPLATLGIASLGHLETGVFTLFLDTTGFVPDTWYVQARSTGQVFTTQVAAFKILARPLG